MKTCISCGVEKSIDDFYRHPMMADGRLGKCKECFKRDVRDNYARKRGEYSDYNRKRQRTPERRAAHIEYTRRYRAKYPERHKAHSAVSKAVHRGLLKKGRCEVCDSANVQAHHDDYSKPLAVRWLCFRHHREVMHNEVVTVDNPVMGPHGSPF